MVLNLSLAANLRSAFVVFVYTNLLFSSRLRFTRGLGPLATGVTSLKFCFSFYRATGVTSFRLFKFLWSDWGKLAQIGSVSWNDWGDLAQIGSVSWSDWGDLVQIVLVFMERLG